MKNTIKAKTGYSVHILVNKKTKKPNGFCYLYDGEKELFRAELRSYADYLDEKEQNECFCKCEVFTTIKGNQYIYWIDTETQEDYLTKVCA